jgi:hypothetical protein
MKNTLTIIGGCIAVLLAGYLLLSGGRVDEVNFLGIRIKGPEAEPPPALAETGDMTQAQELEKLKIERLRLEKEIAELKAQDREIESLSETYAAEEDVPQGNLDPAVQELFDARDEEMNALWEQIEHYNELANQYDPSLQIETPAFVSSCCDLWGNRRCQLISPVAAGSLCFCMFQGTGTAC